MAKKAVSYLKEPLKRVTMLSLHWQLVKEVELLRTNLDVFVSLIRVQSTYQLDKPLETMRGSKYLKFGPTQAGLR